ncbi:head decoration protein [Pelosinus sp. IPA-1]|uniref:head decoration protein n=1 Tax=Pelosinus sp. IPA-1 TaxID=3029569 RepID=UPI0024362709|nr:head decoration protein [Pelosinus sp. IPA-1]GMB00917.1 hypothetical protein PIPA1_37160 [Pelosinus sp. IPA-1]
MQMGSSQIVQYARTEIRAVITDEILLPVTLAPQTGILQAGTVLGMITASNTYTAYATGNSDGSQAAKVILADDADISTGTQIVSVYLCGIFQKAKLTGLDAGAITALGAREPIPGILVVPGC